MAPDQAEREVTACLVIIGNEILSGRTKDANLPYLGAGLNDVGVRLMEVRVIPDVRPVIIETINAVRGLFDYVFTTGGIGPTHDDITAEAVAAAFGVPIERNAEAMARLVAYYATTTFELNEARMKMAEVPVGASLIENPVSGAPGFRMENVFVMAGVPRIMQAMFDSFKHELRGGRPMLARTVVAPIGEGTLAAGLGAIQDAHPSVEIGSYPFFGGGRFGTSLVSRGRDAGELDIVADEIRALVRSHGAEPEEAPL
ncbi:MAG: competence/damage-inducible protein A [Alphaproteobacteria bacterium]